MNPRIQRNLEFFTCDGTHLTYNGFRAFGEILEPIVADSLKKHNDTSSVVEEKCLLPREAVTVVGNDYLEG